MSSSKLRHPTPRVGLIVCRKDNRQKLGAIEAIEQPPEYVKPLLVVRWQDGTVSRERSIYLWDYDSLLIDLQFSLHEAAGRRAGADMILKKRP